MALTNGANPQSTDTLAASAARTASGHGSDLAGEGNAHTLIVELDVTAASGVAPTLDVTIEDTIDGTNYFTIATFAQATAATHAVQLVTGAFSDKIRAKWVIAGTTPSFTFAVTVYSKA